MSYIDIRWMIPLFVFIAMIASGCQQYMVSRNADWTPQEHDFDGVPMMLVPTGCFTMPETLNKERPQHCFDTPFWIDKYETTQAQYREWGDERAFDDAFMGDNLPVDRLLPHEAQAYCERRGAQLPTEAQWAYAYSGPDGINYPWGDEFIVTHPVYSGTAYQTMPIGSREGGISWIGAWDMAGNVWEWVIRTNATGDLTETIASDGTVYIPRGWSWCNDILGSEGYIREWTYASCGVNYTGVRCVRPDDTEPTD